VWTLPTAATTATAATATATAVTAATAASAALFHAERDGLHRSKRLSSRVLRVRRNLSMRLRQRV
jgi:hypothetical protein